MPRSRCIQMAKIFYTIKEASERLNKTEEEVRLLAATGQLEEFRQGENTMFKVDQVELLIENDDDLEELNLLDSSLNIPVEDDLGLGLDSDFDIGLDEDISDADTNTNSVETITAKDSTDESSMPFKNASSNTLEEDLPEDTPTASSQSSLNDSGNSSAFNLDPNQEFDLSLNNDEKNNDDDDFDFELSLDDDPTPAPMEVDPSLDSENYAETSGQDSGLDLGLSDSGEILTETSNDEPLNLADDDAFSDEDSDNFIIEESTDETQVGDQFDEDLSLESVGSGSGLLDLTEETDDTSLGADLLDEVFDSEDDSFENDQENSELFESPEENFNAEDDFDAPLPAATGASVTSEPYDGLWSGIIGGAMIATSAGLLLISSMIIFVLIGSPPALPTLITEQLVIWAGGLGGLTAILTGIGALLGRNSD